MLKAFLRADEPAHRDVPWPQVTPDRPPQLYSRMRVFLWIRNMPTSRQQGQETRYRWCVSLEPEPAATHGMPLDSRNVWYRARDLASFSSSLPDESSVLEARGIS